MRLALPLLALILASGASAQQTPVPALDREPLVEVSGAQQVAPMFDRGPLVSVQGAQRTAPMFDHAPLQRTDGGRVCRDTIHQAREARGLPGEAASPEPGQLIAAVDHRINGCSVMVMRNDTSDVRPLPTMPDGPPQLQRIPRG